RLARTESPEPPPAGCSPIPRTDRPPRTRRSRLTAGGRQDGSRCTPLHPSPALAAPPGRSSRDDPQVRPRLPAAAREVGELGRPAAVRHRPFGQRRDGAYGNRVVHVHVGGQPFAQALDEPIVLEVVHAAMPGAPALLFHLLPQRVIE